MLPTITRREWVWALKAAGLIAMLSTLPYLVGWAVTPPGYRFTGLLINPIDGHSYLAKMGQGAAGSWLFRLPYTVERHTPVLLFTYHLALGWLAPSSSPVALVWVYHVARVLFGVGLLVTVYCAAAMLSSSVSQRRTALLLVGLASGFGWLVGSGTDLTVPESVTFPSLLVNAHFGLTDLLILLVIMGSTLAPRHWGWGVLIGVGSASLTLIQPLAPLVVGVVVGGWLVLCSLRDRRFHWSRFGRLALFSICTLPFLACFWWTIRTNSTIARWMEQNVTPSPPAWQWLAGYGALWLLAAAGAWQATRRRTRTDWLPLVWMVGQLALMMLPMPLQRRLSTGLHLPICFLAASGLHETGRLRVSLGTRKVLRAGMLAGLFLSNLWLMLAGVSAVLSRNPYVIMTDAQWEAMSWLRENLPAETVVLADTELGTLVPAWAGGARVVYGHPFETLDADVLRRAVDEYYSGRMPADEGAAFLDRFGVDVVLVQADRHDIGPLPPSFVPVWQSGSLTIYMTEGM